MTSKPLALLFPSLSENDVVQIADQTLFVAVSKLFPETL